MAQCSFKDPLKDFDWSGLYASYDGMCRGFDPESSLLAPFEPARPPGDRALYYKLTAAFRAIRSSSRDDAAMIYGAMLYWKLYSQHILDGKILDWAQRWGASFGRLVATLPATVERRPQEIVKVATDKCFCLPGMKSGIAVRATVLHFLYPDVVPLFDRMVLRAVAIDSEAASRDRRVFEEYIPHAWSLAGKYRQECSQFRQETPLRVIDMALWANRGRSPATAALPW